MTDRTRTASDTNNALPDNGIGLRIKSAREAQKLSQTDMHNKTGLSRTVLINYEAGRHIPGGRELRKICDALQVSPNYLVYGTEEPHKRQEGLASKILSMQEGGLVASMMLLQILAPILGKDDKRKILEFIELTIKAHSSELLSDVISIIDVMPKPSEIDYEKAVNQHFDPETAKKFLEVIKANIINTPRK